MENRVRETKNSFSNVSRKLDWDMKTASGINSMISDISVELERYVEILNGMSVFFQDSYNMYNQLDSENITRVSTGFEHSLITNESEGIVSSILDWFGNGTKYILDNKYTAKIASKFGVIGGIASIPLALSRAFYDDNYFNIKTLSGLKNVLEVGKHSMKAAHKLVDYKIMIPRLGKLARMLPNQAKKIKWGKLVGSRSKLIGVTTKSQLVGKTIKQKFTKTFAKALKKDLGEYTKGGAKGVLKWGGVVLSAGINLVDNIGEFRDSKGEMTKTRVVAESVTETVVEIAKYTAISAGIVATASLVSVTAPAWAVGGIAIGATVAIDFVVKKDTTEVISDWVLDRGEDLINMIGSAVRVNNVRAKWR